MQRLIMATTVLFGLALGLFVTGGASVSAGAGTPNCPDYDTYAEANDAFLAQGGPEADPFGLDNDRDGFPCEDRPGAPAEAASAPQNVYPTGGGGGTVDPTATTAPAGPIETETPATEVPAVTGGTGTGTTTGSGTTDLPSTGVGATAGTSIGLTTILLALFAGAAITVGATGLIRGRRA